MQKADKNEVALRIKTVATMLINGVSREDIVLYSSESWEIGERQTDKYIARAKKLVEKSVKKELKYDYAKAIRRYESLYKLSIEKKDYKTALSVNKEITALQGLFKQQIEHSGEVQFICSVPD